MKQLFGKSPKRNQPSRASRREPAERRRPVASASPRGFSYYGLQRPGAATPHQRPGYHKNKSRTDRHAGSGSTNLQPTLKRLMHGSGAFIGGIVVLLIIISIIQLDTTPNVKIINGSEGYALHSDADYAAVATSAMRGSLLNTNKITIDTKAVSQTVKEQFPEIKSAAVALPLVGQKPTVYIELTKPVLILNTSTQSVVVDSTGQALVTAQSISGLKQFHLPALYDQSQLELKVGDVVLSSSAVQFIQIVIDQLTRQKLQVKQMVLPAGTEEVDVYLRGDSYFTKYNLHETNAYQQVGTFLAVRQELAGQKGVPAHYIDVRLPGRAYYK